MYVCEMLAHWHWLPIFEVSAEIHHFLPFLMHAEGIAVSAPVEAKLSNSPGNLAGILCMLSRHHSTCTPGEHLLMAMLILPGACRYHI